MKFHHSLMAGCRRIASHKFQFQHATQKLFHQYRHNSLNTRNWMSFHLTSRANSHFVHLLLGFFSICIATFFSRLFVLLWAELTKSENVFHSWLFKCSRNGNFTNENLWTPCGFTKDFWLMVNNWPASLSLYYHWCYHHQGHHSTHTQLNLDCLN